MNSEDRYSCIEPYRDLYPFQPNLLEVPGGKIHYVDVGPKMRPRYSLFTEIPLGLFTTET